jgi:hypothetical protein
MPFGYRAFELTKTSLYGALMSRALSIRGAWYELDCGTSPLDPSLQLDPRSDTEGDADSTLAWIGLLPL